VHERNGSYVVVTDTMEIVTPSLKSARRLGVILRRVMDRASHA
jgi:hypothetical protein